MSRDRCRYVAEWKHLVCCWGLVWLLLLMGLLNDRWGDNRVEVVVEVVEGAEIDWVWLLWMLVLMLGFLVAAAVVVVLLLLWVLLFPAYSFVKVERKLCIVA